MKESFDWVLACIRSCNDPFQLECSKVLISLFEKRYAATEGLGELIGQLNQELIEKDTFISVDV